MGTRMKEVTINCPFCGNKHKYVIEIEVRKVIVYYKKSANDSDTMPKHEELINVLFVCPDKKEIFKAKVPLICRLDEKIESAKPIDVAYLE